MTEPPPSTEVVVVEAEPQPVERRAAPAVSWRQRAVVLRQRLPELARHPAVVASVSAVGANLALAAVRRALGGVPARARPVPQVFVIAVTQQVVSREPTDSPR